MVIFYVWQNIEVMKMNMVYLRQFRYAKELGKENDLLRYKIEKYKRMSVIERNASEMGYRKIDPHDVGVLILKKKK